MFTFQQKIIRHAKKQKSMPHSPDKRNEKKLPKETQILDFLDKYFMSTILIMFNVLKGTKDKELKQTRRTMPH